MNLKFNAHKFLTATTGLLTAFFAIITVVDDPLQVVNVVLWATFFGTMIGIRIEAGRWVD